jgi:hypothetical protein
MPQMASFDLGQFLDLAFWRAPPPDHPMRDVHTAKRLLALLPEDDADTSLADITNWAATMNATQTFTPELRGEIMLLLDHAAQPFWRSLSQRYLAPEGQPAEKHEGDPNILRAFFGCASEFVNGFSITTSEAGSDSRWVEQNLARLHLRTMRWLCRRLALAHMLHLPSIGAIWAQIHRLFVVAEEAKTARIALPLMDGDRYPTSLCQEYARALLLELANPENLTGRQVELVYRITGRVAAAAGVSAQRGSSAAFAVVPAGESRPGAAGRFGPNIHPSPYYLDTANCLPRLRALLERDMGREPTDPDTAFGGLFVIRERHAIIDRLLEQWGMDPPRRRSPRVAMASSARMIAGYEHVATVTAPLEKTWWPGPGQVRKTLQLQLDDTAQSLSTARTRAQRVGPARIADASSSGLGITVHRVDAAWAKPGALVAILIEPRSEWIIGVLRRIRSEENELRLGIQLLSSHPRVIWLGREEMKDANVWEEAMMHEATFLERYVRGILLEPTPLPFSSADLLLPPATASRGTQMSVPLPDGVQGIRIVRLLEDGDSYQRALLESLSIRKS